MDGAQHARNPQVSVYAAPKEQHLSWASVAELTDLLRAYEEANGWKNAEAFALGEAVPTLAPDGMLRLRGGGLGAPGKPVAFRFRQPLPVGTAVEAYLVEQGLDRSWHRGRVIETTEDGSWMLCEFDYLVADQDGEALIKVRSSSPCPSGYATDCCFQEGANSKGMPFPSAAGMVSIGCAVFCRGGNHNLPRSCQSHQRRGEMP